MPTRLAEQIWSPTINSSVKQKNVATILENIRSREIKLVIVLSVVPRDCGSHGKSFVRLHTSAPCVSCEHLGRGRVWSDES